MTLLVTLMILALPASGGDDGNLTRRGGPDAGDLTRKSDMNAFHLLVNMFTSMEHFWFPAAYEQAGHLDMRLRLDANLPVSAVSRRKTSSETMDFQIELEGVATPNGRHALKLTGGLGEVDLVDDKRRSLVASKSFKSFSDTPHRARSKGANLTNYRSYVLSHLGRMKSQMLESGVYRQVYVGSGSYQNKTVHIVRVYKPLKKRARLNGKRPVPLKKMWTFWHDGGYEIWLYEGTNLPAVVFYTNNDDNIFANFNIDYDKNWLPFRINFNNNSVGAEGRGDLVLEYNEKRLLRGASLRFDGTRGISVRADTTLDFGGEPAADTFRILPPFGFRKMNKDHLKLMIMTEISGGLLKLKKYGINLKNFKF